MLKNAQALIILDASIRRTFFFPLSFPFGLSVSQFTIASTGSRVGERTKWNAILTLEQPLIGVIWRSEEITLSAAPAESKRNSTSKLYVWQRLQCGNKPFSMWSRSSKWSLNECWSSLSMHARNSNVEPINFGANCFNSFWIVSHFSVIDIWAPVYTSSSPSKRK